MQPGQHVYAHRHASDKRAVEAFRCGLAVFGCLRDRTEQGRLDEPEIDISDALRDSDVGVIRCARMRRGLTWLQTHVQRNGLVFEFTHVAMLLGWRRWLALLCFG